MFHLSLQDIHLSAIADRKEEEIQQVAQALIQKGHVKSDYLSGMLAREVQSSTYLGNGIAIPHGTVDTRDQVLHTGVQIIQFPQGIEWNAGEWVYLVIGIAARSDEHLALLRQLTHLLSNENLTQAIAQATKASVLYQLLMGGNQPAKFHFEASLITLAVDTDNLMTLQALNAGRLQQISAVDHRFVSEVIAHSPINLGQGIWLSDSQQGNQINAVAVARALTPFELDGELVSVLLTLSMVDEQPQTLLTHLNCLLQAQQGQRLCYASDAASLIDLLTRPYVETSSALSAEFVLSNQHGLHARPGAQLVNTIKAFESQITVANIDGSGVAVNGRSLMKVLGLGAKKGHRLRVTASGIDAQQALITLGQAIHDGLGEK